MILALRALGVGDLLTAVPALRGLRGAFPRQTLALAAPAWLTPLIELIGGVDRIVEVSSLDPVTLPPAEIAVNLHGSGPESHRLLQSAEPAKLWAFANAEAGHLDGPTWTAEEHEVHRWCRLVRHYGVTADETDLRIAAPVAPVEKATIIHPGAKSPSRRWPVDRYAAVARQLRSAGHRVLVTGSASEKELAVRVAERAGLGRDAVPSTGLAELAGLVAHARIVISGDTGIAHLASAYRTPSVVLFGPMSPERWGPPALPQHKTIWHGTRSEPGDSTEPGVHPALLAIEPGEVIDAAQAF
ncbi:glycosyltransferase family 9 protein [Actinoplanes sp. Pm04-4]|uniref:Glycosyltransferase family 9 protein n=1 Tax=Paractinoplanes pyxinae TaxID=2997416 RepID=A0ABT4AXD5_9ACTN|nr:glycosyltransferase family 9 protein [Actinoplanes pyxinae]MCY1138522.1 glycosyltransferase family 9 protein [Actinoplanes pyxinae]